MSNYKMSLEEITNTVANAYYELDDDRSMVKQNFRNFLRKKKPSPDDLNTLAIAMSNWDTRPEGVRASVYRVLALRGHDSALDHYIYLIGNDKVKAPYSFK